MVIANIHEDWQSRAAILMFSDWAQSLIVPMDYIDAAAELNGWKENESTAIDYIIDTQLELGDTPNEWYESLTESYRKWILSNRYPGNFLLQRGEKARWWVCTYTPLQIVLQWEEGNFNANQRITPLSDEAIQGTTPASLAGIMSAMGDWLNAHCPWLLYPLPLSRSLLGTTCKILRQFRGFSVRQVADLAGVSKSTVVNIEAGRFSPTIDIANKLLTCLGATLRIS